MDVQIRKASVEQKVVLRHLLELYKYDFSEFDREDVNDQGLYVTNILIIIGLQLPFAKVALHFPWEAVFSS